MDSMNASIKSVLPYLRPLCRAYALGHITTTVPRLFGFLRVLIRKDVSLESKLRLLFTILTKSTQLNRFPAACAVIIGGATALPRLIKTILQRLLQIVRNKKVENFSPKFLNRLQLVCSFLSAWLAFDLLNRDNQWSRRRAASIAKQRDESAPLDLPSQQTPPPFQPQSTSIYAGKTIDFTLFAFSRAVDTAISTIWTATNTSPYHPANRHVGLTQLIKPLADPIVFATSASIIMWSWFYSPERLPKSYVSWINKAAAIDPSLIKVLRLARQGSFVYGKDTGQGRVLADLCHKLGRPVEDGDPAITAPIPCELYHCGCGPSCEYHALSRLLRSWVFAMKLYLPIQILTQLRPLIRLLQTRTRTSSSSSSRSRTHTLPTLLLHILKSASISSSFLATFISLFYYSVCLARTRLGPKLFPRVTIQAWDSGLCVLAGCLTCGWSILLEEKPRRREIALFVAPRALATVLPRVYDRREMWKEQIVFATSVAVVMRSIGDGSSRHVRGVLGRILAGVVGGS